MKILIIGIGSGGFSALMAARRVKTDVEIVLIEKRDYDMFSPCSMPYAIEGKMSFEEIIHEVPVDKNMTKLLNHEATAINTKEKKVKAKNLKTGEIIEISYDSLIIATGAAPFIPPVEGVKELLGKGVFTLHDIHSARSIQTFAGKSKTAIIVGAGPIGLEVASALKVLGLDVSVVEMLGQVMPRAFDRDMADVVMNHLSEKGIKFFLNQSLEKIYGTGSVESAAVGGKAMPTDMIVLASGVRANWNLAKDAGIEPGRWGIKTDIRMETNVKGIYAVGDCAEIYDPVLNRQTMMQLATAAYKQGMVAGTNAAGGYDTYAGGLNTFGTVIGDLEIASTGPGRVAAESAGFMTVSGKAKGKTKSAWYPGAADLTVKIIADAETGAVLGGQAIGDGASARINVVSMAVRNRLSVYDLSNTELAYCPAISEYYDALTKAADFAIRSLKKGK